MKVYLSASSSELPRVRHWGARVTDAGMSVSLYWFDGAEAWAGRDQDKAIEAQRSVAAEQARAIANCGVFWLLFPSEPRESSALIELGYALAKAPYSVVTGARASCRVWTSLANYRDASDALGWVYVCRIAAMKKR